MHIKSILTICFVFFNIMAFAQSSWVNKGPIYERGGLTIFVEYRLSETACDGNGTPSLIRYRAIGKHSFSDIFLNWSMDYYDCANELVSKSFHLKITPAVVSGIIPNETLFFKGNKVASYKYGIKENTKLVSNPVVKNTYPNSLEARSINGRLQINAGESTTLSVYGGTLGEGANWKWYADACGTNMVGSGKSLTIAPSKSTTYFVRAEGKNITDCVSASVDVKESNISAGGILGKEVICRGEGNVRLQVSGGKLLEGAKWCWYKDACGQGNKIGEGQSIEVNPQISTVFYVRAEGAGQPSNCQNFKVTVLEPTVNAQGISGPREVLQGQYFSLEINGGILGTNAQWTWYADENGQKNVIGKGRSITGLLANQSVTYYANAEGGCGNSPYLYKFIRVKAIKQPKIAQIKPILSRPASGALFIFNAGVTTNDVNNTGQFSNFMGTVGYGRNFGGYLRIKFSTDQTKSSYASTGNSLTDFNSPGYYLFNGQTKNKRAGYTAGIFFGGKVASVYLGGGYGTRELLWGVDLKSYQDPLNSSPIWSTNVPSSFQGAEAEAGVLIRLGFFNLMGGISSINFKYNDIHAGIGFNIR
ncbi:hypothetical protein IM793_22890 [Pedobacter sp. MR2016-19]|uniref:immunoglobulin domain-containing protein n=1 Tax=Pedobacter sp. MR2016-19 TaxID=2780089 RepID=UPI0018774714|nr:hypothetical protein [Pedobacter sp. MR2016-19]MBE5322020.1 hypothetical protein [Pedobacter sp. MR2016-19]